MDYGAIRGAARTFVAENRGLEDLGPTPRGWWVMEGLDPDGLDKLAQNTLVNSYKLVNGGSDPEDVFRAAVTTAFALGWILQRDLKEERRAA